MRSTNRRDDNRVRHNQSRQVVPETMRAARLARDHIRFSKYIGCQHAAEQFAKGSMYSFRFRNGELYTVFRFLISFNCLWFLFLARRTNNLPLPMLGQSSAVIRVRCDAVTMTSYSPSVPIGVPETSSDVAFEQKNNFMVSRTLCLKTNGTSAKLTVLRLVCSCDSYKYLFDIHRLLKEHTSR